MNAPDPAQTRLPRGRHKLSRSDIAMAQRARILDALAEVMTVHGYAGTPVAAVLARARVSRETFYQQFDSKQDCFIAALIEATDRLAGGIASLIAADPGPPIDTFDRLLKAYLAALAGSPATARMFLIETYAAGPEAMNRRLDLQHQFRDALIDLFGATADRDRFACEALMATVISSATAHFVRSDQGLLDHLRAPLVELARSLLINPGRAARSSADS